MLLDLSGRKALVTAIAQQLHLAGAELGVQNPDQVEAAFQQLERQWGQLDILCSLPRLCQQGGSGGGFQRYE